MFPPCRCICLGGCVRSWGCNLDGVTDSGTRSVDRMVVAHGPRLARDGRVFEQARLFCPNDSDQ
jgi:hypothetical protein